MYQKPDKVIATPQDDAVAFFSSLAQSAEADWSRKEQEGQLSVDVMETADELVLVATMAGTKPEDIELHLHNDYLTIRGRRQAPAEPINYFTKECFWGNFSRTIVLPVDVKGDQARSEYKHGVLTVRLPKTSRTSSIPIVVIEE